MILLRLEDERSANKIKILEAFLKTFHEPITQKHFIVLTEKVARVIHSGEKTDS